LYQMICSTVERVTREYEEDSQIFVDVIADLKSWIDSDSKRIELRKKRLVDAEAGRDESATARAAVKAVIEQQRLQDAPGFIVEFMQKTWGNILFLAYLQKNRQIEPWQEALDTMDSLLWTVSVQRCRDDRSAILARLPGLLKALRKGLESVNHDTPAVTEFFSQLERVHMQVMQRAEAQAIAQPEAAHTGDQQPGGAQRLTTEPGPANQAAPDSDQTQQAAPKLAQAQSLAVGQWVEIHEHNNKKRCRLVAILRNSGKRIFINRTGSKAAELEVEEIAAMLDAGEMLLLEDAQLFDKALTSIIDGLRKQQHVAVGA
ncbi:MAG: DUF1631 domain-containing protein, partial [Gammaproteobacteria bacterium]|nr:DUF1631 domain-containing protein [Gammaproteobacteria bacterium]